MRVGHVDGGWEVILKIPQKHMGKLLQGFQEAAEDDNDGRGKYLWVDVLVTSQPTPGHQGRGKQCKVVPGASVGRPRDRRAGASFTRSHRSTLACEEQSGLGLRSAWAEHCWPDLVVPSQAAIK